MTDQLLNEEILPNIQPEPPLAQLEAISSWPETGSLGEEANPHLPTVSFQVTLESDKVPPESPFLQAKPPQLSQLLLIRTCVPDPSPAS